MNNQILYFICVVSIIAYMFLPPTNLNHFIPMYGIPVVWILIVILGFIKYFKFLFYELIQQTKNKTSSLPSFLGLKVLGFSLYYIFYILFFIVMGFFVAGLLSIIVNFSILGLLNLLLWIIKFF